MPAEPEGSKPYATAVTSAEERGWLEASLAFRSGVIARLCRLTRAVDMPATGVPCGRHHSNTLLVSLFTTKVLLRRAAGGVPAAVALLAFVPDRRIVRDALAVLAALLCGEGARNSNVWFCCCGAVCGSCL